MPRRSIGPWPRKGRGWYVTIRGEQVKLAPSGISYEDAVRLWHEELAKPRREHFDAAPPNEISAFEVSDRYIIWVKRNRAEATSSLIERYLKPWGESLPRDLLAEKVRPFDASEWIDLRYKKHGARRAAYRAVKAAFKWAEDSGLIDRNPLRGIKVPAGGRRETVLTKQQYALCLASASPQLKLLMRVARLTGMRAQEIIRVESRHLDRKAKSIDFPRDEAKGRRRPRTVFVIDEAWTILIAAAKKHKSGPALRNEDGNPWTKDSVGCAFKRMRKRLKNRKVNGNPAPVDIPGLCMTTLRHTYATDAIENGVDVLTLAELMGHKDGKMLSEVYAKPGQRLKHMRKAAAKAVK